MRRVLPLCALVVALAGASGAALADDMDGWCAQVTKASSIVICSDAELRRQAIARNELFEAARGKLSPEALKALTDDQSRWIKSYTAGCGISIDDPPPPMPIPQTVIDCYRRESLARTAYLATRLSVPNPATAPPPATAGRAPPSLDEILGPPPARPANPFDAFDKNGMPRAPRAAWQAAMDAWYRCLYDAVDALADQPEPARTVTDAGFGSCTKEEANLKDSADVTWDFVEKLKAETVSQQVTARVMAVRAARAKLRKEDPETKPAINYNRM